MATAGIILGWIGVVIVLLFLAFVALMLVGVSTEGGDFPVD